MKNKDDAFILNFDSRCNQRCLFCMVSNAIDDKENIVTFKEISKQIIHAKRVGFTKIDFFGGEPTVYPFLIQSISLANSLGLTVTLATNAVKFSSSTYAQKICREKIAAIRTSIHSHRPDVHDLITQVKGSHQKAVQGIKNIIKYRGSEKLCITIVITSLNYKNLSKIVNLVNEIGATVIKFSGLSPNGRILVHPTLFIDPLLVQPHLIESIQLCQRIQLLFFIEKMPLHILHDYPLKKWHFIKET